MKKRMIAFLTMLALLTGCGSSQTPGNAEENGRNESHEGGASNGRNASHESGAFKEGDGSKEAGTSGIQEGTYTPPEMKGELSLCAMYEDEFITNAVNSFMAKYPDVTVKVNTFMSITDDYVDAVSYQSFVNTKIMSGNAEDLIFASAIPTQKYIDMGVFEDLSYYMSGSNEFTEENYWMNVLTAPREESGRQYIIPYKFSFQVLYLDRKLIDEQGFTVEDQITRNYGEAVELAERLVDNTAKDNTYLSLEDALGHMQNLVMDNLEDLIDVKEKRVSLVEKGLYEELLNQVKDAEAKGYFIDRNKEFNPYNVEYYFALTGDFAAQAAYYALALDNPAFVQSDRYGNVQANSMGGVGINSASPNKALAWEFIRHMLSEEVQAEPSNISLGVHRKGFEAGVKRQYQFYNQNEGWETTPVTLEAYHNLLKSWTEQINSYYFMDNGILDLMYVENKKFLEGSQSAEETARILQAKIEKYFYE